MEYPFVDIHTHSRRGEGIEVVSVMAGRQDAGDAVIASGATPKSGFWPEPPFSIGVHPWQTGKVDLEAALREVETAPASAIGEIGLDFAGPGDRSRQKMAFADCLRIAERRRLPVVLHCVRAFEPTMEILAEYRLPAVIFHGFVGSREQAERAVRAGYFLSLGERSLSSPRTAGALGAVPLENIFLETDESSLSIAEIYARAAEILGVPAAEISKKIYGNFTKIFITLPRNDSG